MRPIKFKEVNVTFAENQPEYVPIPGYKEPQSVYGEFIFCMKLTFWERIKLLLTGKIWVEVLTFNDPLQPMNFTVKKSDLITTVSDEAYQKKDGPTLQSDSRGHNASEN